MRLHVGFYNEKGILITHPLYTAKHYIHNAFAIDLFACTPFDRIVHGLFDEGGKKRKIRKIEHLIFCTRVLQIYRLPAIFNHIADNILKKYTIAWP